MGDDEAAGDRPWASAVATVSARQIRRFREARGWNVRQLSERCEALGYPIPRNVLLKIEGGYRRYLTVAETLILARALDVPPVHLVLPLGTEATYAAAPGLVLPADEALVWFTGDDPADEAPGPRAAVAEAASLLRHRRLVAAMIRTHRRAEKRPGDQEAAQDALHARSDLGMYRREMRLRGEVPPAMPQEWAAVIDQPWDDWKEDEDG